MSEDASSARLPGQGKPLPLAGYLVAAGLIWTATLAASLAWNVHRTHHAFLTLAVVEARSSFAKDLLYRRWNALQGGVYVVPSERTPPNPWLAGVPERDLETTDGRRLTLVNPAYMTRQAHELAAKEHGTVGHLTSLNPLRPQNAPDPWEAEALAQLEDGSTEVVKEGDLDGAESLRFMGRLVVESPCLKCHAGQGYQLGDVRGGISVTVPMAPYLAAGQRQSWALGGWHLLIWVVGLAGLVVAGRRIGLQVAEREAAHLALRQAEQALASSRRLEAIGRLASGVAHDLNNVLAPILSHANAAQEDLPPGTEVQQDLTQVIESAQRARGLVRRLLAFARSQPAEVLPLDLSEVLSGLLPMLRDVVGRHVELVADLATGLPAVEVDRGQLETVLINLAANARDALPSGGRLQVSTASLVLEAALAERLELRAGPHVALTVQDGGVGMGPEVLARIFEPFFTTKPVGQGTGLGLASVHGVVKQHGGAVTVTSALGQGTTFQVLFPAGSRPAIRRYPPEASPSDSSSPAVRSQSS